MFLAATLLIRLSLAWVATTLVPPPAPACQVELQPGDAPRAWIAAAAAVRDSLRERVDADRDCRAVVIHASRERPSVEIVTLDGRRGVRQLADAGDVAATVAALIVTVKADGGPSGDDDAAERQAFPALVRSVPEAAAPVPIGWRPQIFVGGGGRRSQHSTQAVQLEVAVGIARPGWELGLFGAWAPTTVATRAAATRAFGATAEAALGGAWRPALGGSGIDMFVGARAGIIQLADVDNGTGGTGSTSTGTDSNSPGTVNDNVMDPSYEGLAPAVTGFVGAVFATHSIVRVRPQLWYQWMPRMRLAGGQTATGSLSSVGLSLGVESRVP